ncbi:MAG: nitrophenyl compound nitroreductase subunit ArsF family protein [Draconibacterium sp.]
MKLFKAILFMLFLSPVFAFSQTNTKIEAYYFHNKTRCTTCKTVEAEAKADLKELYGDKVTFKALNLEEKSTDAIATKLKVSGQTLLVVKGDKQVNLTNEGFLYAVTDPDKFKAKIKEKVDPLVK